MKKVIFSILIFLSYYVHGQWSDGLLLDVQDVDIKVLREVRMQGAEAVMKVAEQFIDGNYRYAFLTNNYLIPQVQREQLNVGRERFLIVITGYPGMNHLIYTQVFYDDIFFVLAFSRREGDMRWDSGSGIQIVKMNYDKFNILRRNNVRDTMQENNFINMGFNF